MYCIAILTDQEQEGQNCAEYIRNYCTEKKVFPLIEIYQNQEQFFGRIRKTVPAVVFLALSGVSGLNAAEPVSYTHLDVYKRQVLHFLFIR